MNKITFGVIGAGAIAISSCQSISEHPQAVLAAAADLDAGRLDNLAERFGIDKRYREAEALLADDGLDAVYIAVPNKFHAPLAIQALRAGKHVVIDKPFAMHLAEAQAVAAEAERSGKIFTVGMNQRFRAESQTVRALCRDGVLGEIYHAKAWWNRRSGIPRLGTWFGSKALAGGGCLLDIGVHMLDLCLYCLGDFDAVAVSGATYTRFGNRGLGEGSWGKSDRAGLPFDVDDFATALIKMRSGATISLDVSWACHTGEANSNDVKLFGVDAGASCYPARLFRADPLRQGYDVIDNLQPRLDYPHCDRFHNFINALLGTEALCTSIAESLAVQRILDAVYASCASGREVVLGASTATATVPDPAPASV